MRPLVYIYHKKHELANVNLKTLLKRIIPLAFSVKYEYKLIVNRVVSPVHHDEIRYADMFMEKYVS